MPLSAADQKFAKGLLDKRDSKVKALSESLKKTEKFLKQIKAMPLDSFLKIKSKTQAQSKAGQVKRQSDKIKDLKDRIKALKNADLLSTKGQALLASGGKRRKKRRKRKGGTAKKTTGGKRRSRKKRSKKKRSKKKRSKRKR